MNKTIAWYLCATIITCSLTTWEKDLYRPRTYHGYTISHNHFDHDSPQVIWQKMHMSQGFSSAMGTVLLFDWGMLLGPVQEPMYSFTIGCTATPYYMG